MYETREHQTLRRLDEVIGRVTRRDAEVRARVGRIGRVAPLDDLLDQYAEQLKVLRRNRADLARRMVGPH